MEEKQYEYETDEVMQKATEELEENYEEDV